MQFDDPQITEPLLEICTTRNGWQSDGARSKQEDEMEHILPVNVRTFCQV